MDEWTIAEWYPVLKRGDVIISGDWFLYPRDRKRVELIRQDGEMCRAEVEEDGVCRVRTEKDILPLPLEVVLQLQSLLNLKGL